MTVHDPQRRQAGPSGHPEVGNWTPKAPGDQVSHFCRVLARYQDSFQTEWRRIYGLGRRI